MTRDKDLEFSIGIQDKYIQVELFLIINFFYFFNKLRLKKAIEIKITWKIKEQFILVKEVAHMEILEETKSMDIVVFQIKKKTLLQEIF